VLRDLSDLNKDGRLTRDGFAVAMHLIHGKLAGKEIPISLPQSLIPPYMRADTTATPLQHEPQDLFTWDETPPPSAAAPPTISGLQSTPTGTQSSITTSSAFTLQSSTSDPFGSAILGEFVNWKMRF
jgi:epidermal growth factor receptor substrate 15